MNTPGTVVKAAKTESHCLTQSSLLVDPKQVGSHLAPSANTFAVVISEHLHMTCGGVCQPLTYIS